MLLCLNFPLYSVGWYFDFASSHILLLYLLLSFHRVLMYTSFFVSFTWAGLLLIFFSFRFASYFGRGWGAFSRFTLGSFYLCFFEDISRWDIGREAGVQSVKFYNIWGRGVLLSENLGWEGRGLRKEQRLQGHGFYLQEKMGINIHRLRSTSTSNYAGGFSCNTR